MAFNSFAGQSLETKKLLPHTTEIATTISANSNVPKRNSGHLKSEFQKRISSIKSVFDTKEDGRKTEIFTIISLILGLTAGAIGLATGSILIYRLVALIGGGFAALGWAKIRKNPEKYKGEGLAILGIIVGIIGACIGLGIAARM